jgi:hypothetical protein
MTIYTETQALTEKAFYRKAKGYTPIPVLRTVDRVYMEKEDDDYAEIYVSTASDTSGGCYIFELHGTQYIKQFQREFSSLEDLVDTSVLAYETYNSADVQQGDYMVACHGFAAAYGPSLEEIEKMCWNLTSE